MAESATPISDLNRNRLRAMKRLQLLDYARLLAALSVLTFHYLYNGIRNGKIAEGHYHDGLSAVAQYGYLGVELFFMISGYVIFFSAARSTASSFAIARCVRLYPAFWAAVLLTSLAAHMWGGAAMTVTFPQVLANLTMLPAVFGQPFVDGVYWTLAYELQFYALVAGLLAAGLRPKLEKLAIAWPLAILAVTCAGQNTLPFLSGPYLFFASGAVLAVARRAITPIVALSLAISLVLCVLNAVGDAVGRPTPEGMAYHPAIVAAIICLLFGFFLVLNTPWASQLQLKGSVWAGALSYPLYLVHAHIGYMLISRMQEHVPVAVAYAATVMAAVAMAFALHFAVERPSKLRADRRFAALFSKPGLASGELARA